MDASANNSLTLLFHAAINVVATVFPAMDAVAIAFPATIATAFPATAAPVFQAAAARGS